jgi:hypothetical protein
MRCHLVCKAVVGQFRHPNCPAIGEGRRHIYTIATWYSTTMPAKGKAADKGAAAKGKGKGKADEEEKGAKVKGAQQINVRHILVSCVARPMNGADI